MKGSRHLMTLSITLSSELIDQLTVNTHPRFRGFPIPRL